MRARVHFDQELETLTTELYNLGDMVVQAIQEAFHALSRRDVQSPQHVIDHDRAINQAERNIEAHVLSLIATQQPVASDMRQLIVTIEIASELERIADYAKGTLVWRCAICPRQNLPCLLKWNVWHTWQ